MRKALVFMILIFSASVLSARMTSTASLTISGYKNQLTVDTLFYADVKFLDSESALINTESEHDLTNTLQNNTTLQDAFTVTVYSNLNLTHHSQDIQMTFTPFISQSNPSETVPVTYSFTKDNISEIQADSSIYAMYSQNGGAATLTEVEMKYTPGMKFKNSSGTSITSLNVSSTTTATLSMTIDTVKFRKVGASDWSTNSSGAIPVWRDSEGTPIATDVLPGMTSSVITTKAHFALSVSNFNLFAADTKYIANVILTVVSP